jgi:hypothetical protein
MSFDPIKTLEQAGVSLAPASDQQRAILANLSPQEVDVIAKVNRGFAAVDPEVEGHLLVIGAGIF